MAFDGGTLWLWNTFKTADAWERWARSGVACRVDQKCQEEQVMRTISDVFFAVSSKNSMAVKSGSVITPIHQQPVRTRPCLYLNVVQPRTFRTVRKVQANHTHKQNTHSNNHPKPTMPTKTSGHRVEPGYPLPSAVGAVQSF
eukprot:459890-Rhodomonas_salina.1